MDINDRRLMLHISSPDFEASVLEENGEFHMHLKGHLGDQLPRGTLDDVVVYLAGRRCKEVRLHLADLS